MFHKIINRILREISSLSAKERTGFDAMLDPLRKFGPKTSNSEVEADPHAHDPFMVSDGKEVTFHQFNQEMAEHFSPDDQTEADSGQPETSIQRDH